MSVAAGPNVVDDGLVFAFDAANPKSYNYNLVTDMGSYGYGMAAFNESNLEYDIDPTGENVLCKYDLTGISSPYLNVNVDTPLKAGNYNISGWFKGTTSFSASFALVGQTVSEAPNSSISITTDWQRFSVNVTLANDQNNSRVQLFFGTQGNDKIVSIYGVMLVRGSTLLPYRPNNGFNGNSTYNVVGDEIGTLNGNVIFDSANSSSLFFAGTSSDYIDVDNYKGVTGTEARSVNIWFKSAVANTQQRLVAWGNNSTGEKYTIRSHDDPPYSLRNEINGTNWFGSNTEPNIVDLNWHMLTVVNQANSVMSDTILYVDSVAIQDYSYTADPSLAINTAASTNVSIGFSVVDGFEPVNGNIAQVLIYNRALTSAEVRQNFEATRRRFNL